MRAVRAVIVARSVGERLAGALTWTQSWMLYSVDDLRVRRRLAQQIFDGKLEGEEAKAAIEKESKKEQHGGQPARSAAARAMGKIERIIEWAKGEGAFEAAELEGVKEREARKVLKELREAIEVLEGFATKVQGALDT